MLGSKILNQEEEIPPPVVSRLVRLYPYFKNTELAEILEIPVWVIEKYARKLQLRKCPIYMRMMNHNSRTLRIEKPNMKNIVSVAKKILEMYDGEIKKGSILYLKGKRFVNKFYGRKIGRRKRNQSIDARNVFNYAIRYLHKFGIAERWNSTPYYKGCVWKIDMWKLIKFLDEHAEE